MRATSAFVQDFLTADQGERPRRHLPGRLQPACTASAARPSRPRRSSSTASAPTTAPSRSGSRSGTGSSACPPTRNALLAIYDEQPGVRAAGLPLQRGPQLHRGRAARFLDQPRDADLGGADPVGSRSGRLRLGRRARQLPERAPLRARREPRALLAGARTSSAKDILRFHCVYWPALLLAAGYEPPRQLFVHGYLNIDQQKISKSLGNVIDPLELIDVYGADAVRFWCARQVTFGQDGDVTIDSFRERYETRARERPRQPRLADDGDDRPLPRRPPRQDRPARAPSTPMPCARRSSSDSTDTTSPARSRRSGRPSVRSTSTSSRARRGSSRRTRRRRASSTRSSTTSPTGSSPSPSPSRRTCPRPRRASSPRSASPATSRSTASPRRPPSAAEGIEPSPPLFPRVEEPAPAA